MTEAAPVQPFLRQEDPERHTCIDPFRPRAVEVRGRAEVVTEPEPLIRIHPERIVPGGTDPDHANERKAGS